MYVDVPAKPRNIWNYLNIYTNLSRCILLYYDLNGTIATCSEKTVEGTNFITAAPFFQDEIIKDRAHHKTTYTSEKELKEEPIEHSYTKKLILWKWRVNF